MWDYSKHIVQRLLEVPLWASEACLQYDSFPYCNASLILHLLISPHVLKEALSPLLRTDDILNAFYVKPYFLEQVLYLI